MLWFLSRCTFSNVYAIFNFDLFEWWLFCAKIPLSLLPLVRLGCISMVPVRELTRNTDPSAKFARAPFCLRVPYFGRCFYMPSYACYAYSSLRTYLHTIRRTSGKHHRRPATPIFLCEFFSVHTLFWMFAHSRHHLHIE